MALTTTLLDEFALKYSESELDAYEHRMESYGAYETYRADTPNLIPGYAKLIGERRGPNRVVRVPVGDRYRPVRLALPQGGPFVAANSLFRNDHCLAADHAGFVLGLVQTGPPRQETPKAGTGRL